ncbi:MAG: tyrosine-type recombinase/integrase [Ilumatobacteraceae bacterium]
MCRRSCAGWAWNAGELTYRSRPLFDLELSTAQSTRRSPAVRRALDIYIGERTTGPIFLGVEGGRMDRYCTDRMVKRLVKRAGITKRISPHSLRHSFITAALDAGVPLRDVREAASHADPRTTMRYDRARRSLDRHATSVVSTFVAGRTRPG